jgi:hypothetical protein
LSNRFMRLKVKEKKEKRKKFWQCYPNELRLEEQDIENGSFSFLEMVTKISENSITIRHRSDEICKTGNQLFFNLQSSDSFSDGTPKRVLKCLA